jgi:CheY-like chemotaxis protein
MNTGLTLEAAYELFHSTKTVLVVEDEVDILSSLAEAIREDGYHVVTAANGFQALSEVQDHEPDLIFLDLMMPRMNGWKFVEELRKRFPGCKAPIVLLSAARDLPAEAAKLKVEHFLRKPFGLRDVNRIARECCPLDAHPAITGGPSRPPSTS